LFWPIERDWELQIAPQSDTENLPYTQLTINTEDRSIGIIVRDVERKPLVYESGYGSWNYSVSPGFYYIALVIPGSRLRNILLRCYLESINAYNSLRHPSDWN
jgi:hypothetical protein